MSAISVNELSKEYRLGQIGHDTLRDSLAAIGHGVRNFRLRQKAEILHALRDVSFEIGRGEVVGIVGHNGAGKSTLLKILSRITAPTAGTVTIRGRVGSLLEVGTGFHPDLTGRENVYLNGAILGMRRGEVERKFDEIVEFSGVSRFIDTPVKRYSSGMQVRLAFSVAAHLEPEIMLVDEVLTVGDAEFQRKCLGRMQSIGESNRTVLFVSHNLAAVARLCPRILLFEQGRLVADGPPEQVIPLYLHSGWGLTSERTWNAEDAPGNDAVRIRAARVVGGDGELLSSADPRRRIGIEMTFEVLADVEPFVPWIAVYTDQAVHVFTGIDVDPFWADRARPGVYRATMWIPPNLLNEGSFIVSLNLITILVDGRLHSQAHAGEALAFQVVDPPERTPGRASLPRSWPGPVRPLLDWEIKPPVHRGEFSEIGLPSRS